MTCRGGQKPEGLLDEVIGFQCDGKYKTYFIDPHEVDRFPYIPDDWKPTHISGPTVTIDCACNATGITKPLIVVEGFDLGNVRNYYQFLNNDLDEPVFPNDWYEWVRDRRNEGFDVMYVDFQYDYDLSIEYNANQLLKLLEWVNREKALNGSKYDNMIIGASMGGLITRYAMALNENAYGVAPNPKHHDVGTFVSFDAPQTGANLPLSLQMTMFRLHKMSWKTKEDLNKKMAAINSMASQQMNMYHVQDYVNRLDKKREDYTYNKLTINSVHKNFMQSLEAIPNHGYPLFSQNIALLNGSGEGKVMDPNFYSNHSMLEVDRNTFFVDTELDSRMTYSASNKRWLFYFMRKIYWYVPFKIVIHKSEISFFQKLGLSLDNAPGGGNNVHEVIKDGLVDDNGANWDDDEIDLHGLRMHSYMPAISAAGIDFPGDDYAEDYQNRNYYAKLSDPNVMQYSRFDKVYYPANNQPHVFRDDQLVNQFWLEQVGPDYKYIQNTPMFDPKAFHAFREMYVGKDVAPASFNLAQGDVVLQLGADVDFSAADMVHIKPGFRSELGAKMHVFIDQKTRGNCGTSAAGRYASGSEENHDTESGMLDGVERNAQGLEEYVMVYPNPTSDQINVTLKGLEAKEYSVQLSSLMGASLMYLENQKSNQLTLDVSHLKPGVYLFQLVCEGLQYNKRIIIQ